MPHFPKPFFREQRGLWYVQIHGKQVNLGGDRNTAVAHYHKLMAEAGRVETPTGKAASQPVIIIIDEFLDWCQKHRSRDTFRWYKDRLNWFCQSISPELTVDQLKPFHVQQWVDNRGAMASGTQRNLIASVKRAMRWGEEMGHIDRSPLAHMRKPACGRKEQIVTPEEFQKILSVVKDQEFRNLLMVSFECGARPQETLRLEARHVDLANGRWVFPASEAKGGRLPRVVYVPPASMQITERLMEAHPVGVLFRNSKGKPWTADAVNCRFGRIQRKLNVRYSLYSLRHSWVNRMLTNGVDGLTVAALAGHADASMLVKHYAHLSQAPTFLREQAKRASA
jgi:integrase